MDRLNDQEAFEKYLEYQAKCMELGFRLGMGEKDAFDKVFNKKEADDGHDMELT